MALIQINQKLLHITITLLIYGVRLESVKCPEGCHCVETSVFYNANLTRTDADDGKASQGMDPNGIGLGIPGVPFREEVTVDLNDIDEESYNKTVKNTKNGLNDIFIRNFSTESFPIRNSKEIRSKRTLKPNDSISGSGPESQGIDRIRRESSKSSKTGKGAEVSPRVPEEKKIKEFLTYQITCNEIRDLKALPMGELPDQTTQLIIQGAYFQSVDGFYRTLKESSSELRMLTDLSITNCVIGENVEKNSTIKEETSSGASNEGYERKMRDFLPFASLQNPRPRSKSKQGLEPDSRFLLILNLSNSTLRSLPGDVFKPYPRLQTLDLSNNLIEELDDEIFAGLTNLLRLDLHGNRIKAVNESVFRNLTKLLILNMSRNSISNIPPSTFQYLTSLNTLILSDNPLSVKQQSMMLLGTGKRLQIVDASKTGLKQIPGTLERSVQTLNLKGNYLSSIQCGDLDSYSLLTYLDLGNNKISYVEDDALGRLELLTDLQINENNLFQIPKSLPNNLEILNLSYNNIQNITNSDFLNLSLLKELSISYNQVNNIEENSFDNLGELRTLDLSHNPILILPNMYGLVKLTTLNLSYFTNIPNHINGKYEEFPTPSPENIRVLNLESSPLLTRTFLQDTKTLQSFASLEELYLRFSNLTIIRKDILGLLPKLRVLRVGSNPWHCDREILQLSEWLRSHTSDDDGDESEANTAHCATPQALHKKPLIALSREDFSEDRRMPSRQGKIEKLNAGNLLKNRMTLKRIPEIQSKDEIYFKSFQKPIDYTDDREIEELSNAPRRSEIDFADSKNISMQDKETEAGPNLVMSQTIDTLTENETEASECCSNSTEGGQETEESSAPAEDKSATESVRTVGYAEWTVSYQNETGSVEKNFSSPGGSIPVTELSPYTEVTKAEAMHVKDAISPTLNENSHPRQILVTFVSAVVLATAVVTILHFTKSRKSKSYDRQTHDIEVHSISSVGNELW